MTARTCWACGAYAEMRPVSESLTARRVMVDGREGYLFHAAYICTQCQALSIGRHCARESYQGVALMREQDPVVWLPPKPLQEDFPDVPQHIAEAATEATLCRSVGAYRAVGSLARAVVEATAKDKGVNGRDLRERIDNMHAQGLIRAGTAEAAHEVRHFGNDMAHGDFVDPVDEDDADEVLALMKEVLQEVYQGPARVDRQRAKREANKAGPEGSREHGQGPPEVRRVREKSAE